MVILEGAVCGMPVPVLEPDGQLHCELPVEPFWARTPDGPMRVERGSSFKVEVRGVAQALVYCMARTDTVVLAHGWLRGDTVAGGGCIPLSA